MLPSCYYVHDFTGKQLRSFSNFNLNRFLISVCQQMIWLMLLPHLVTGDCYFTLSNVIDWNLYIRITSLFYFNFLFSLSLYVALNCQFLLFSLQLFWLHKCFSCKFLPVWPSCLFDMHILLELWRIVLIASCEDVYKLYMCQIDSPYVADAQIFQPFFLIVK